MAQPPSLANVARRSTMKSASPITSTTKRYTLSSQSPASLVRVVPATAVVQNHSQLVKPTSGDYMAQLRTYNGSAVNNITSLSYDFSVPVLGKYTFSFDVFFDTNISLPYNDKADVLEVILSGSQAGVTEVLYSSSVAAVGDKGHSGWQHVSQDLTFGTYLLQFILTKKGNSTLETYFYVDSVRICGRDDYGGSCFFDSPADGGNTYREYLQDKCGLDANHCSFCLPPLPPPVCIDSCPCNCPEYFSVVATCVPQTPKPTPAPTPAPITPRPSRRPSPKPTWGCPSSCEASKCTRKCKDGCADKTTCDIGSCDCTQGECFGKIACPSGDCGWRGLKAGDPCMYRKSSSECSTAPYYLCSGCGGRCHYSLR